MAERTQPEDITAYIPFGEVARQRCGMQCQYASRHLSDEFGADLGSDLRWFGDTHRYHGLMIHKVDADEFVRRARVYRTEGMMGWSGEPG